MKAQIAQRVTTNGVISVIVFTNKNAVPGNR
jgi:hypothetical protein